MSTINENNSNYMMKMRPLLKTSAVFSDETPYYRRPYQPKCGEKVTIRLRTAEDNVDAVYLRLENARILMTVAETKHGFDFYEGSFVVKDTLMTYYFEIITGDHRVFYNKKGLSGHEDKSGSFLLIPDYEVPAWCHGAVMYQIYVDRFCNGDPANDVVSGEYVYLGMPVKAADNWSDRPTSFDVARFYGGDLSGVRAKLDYLQELGVEVIYFNPLFVSPSNHKYDTQDYEHIDPHLGVIVEDGGRLVDEAASDNADAARYIKRVTSFANLEASDKLFEDFMTEIHSRGMRVIIDGVFNHCGSFNKWLDREGLYESRDGYEVGAYRSEDSPYSRFFQFTEKDWPNNDSYEGWWGHSTLPKLNYDESPQLVKEVLKIAEKWVSPPYCVDGWRLDVAADLGHTSDYNHEFWRLFRRTVKRANPEAVILAEHYGDASSYLRGGEWDTVMNYDAFMEPLTFFLTGMEKHSDEYFPSLIGDGRSFFETMTQKSLAFGGPSLLSAMNELDNHDHSRFLTRTNHKVGRLAELGSEAAGEDISLPVMRQAVLMQMTWPGAPTLYYGDEAGMVGFTDPDNRRTFPWGAEDEALRLFYKKAIEVHRTWQALRDGSLIALAAEQDLVSYSRFTDEEQVIVIVHTGDKCRKVTLPAWISGLDRTESDSFRQLIKTSKDEVVYDDDDGTSIYTTRYGVLDIMMDPCSAVILGRRS